MEKMGDDEQSLQDQNGEVAGQPAGEEIAYVDPWVGQYLSDYYIIRRIGEGGMGIVYLARHQSLDRLAAVKFLGAHMVDDKGYIDRFLNEARGAAKLNHPSIVSVYDAGSIGENIYYFIMEYIEGRDLGTLLRERRVFPVPEAVGYIRQAALALGYAHKKRIIHRDIKPDNLMLTNEGVIKVGDLGLAKWIADDGSGGMTQSGIVMGTPFYISPEQVRGSRDVDWRSDIYSLGATLHHMVTGRIPYEGTSPAVIMAMHLNNPVPEPSHVNTSLDSEICAIIKSMMAKNVEDRFQTMEQVDAILADYQAGKMRSAQFSPAAAAPLAYAPPTEPQQLPSEPPERLRSPNILQSEPGAPVKIATIIGVSIIIAAVILGFFISSVINSREKSPQASSAARSSPPPATQPQANNNAAQKRPENPPPGLVTAQKPIDIKLPETVSSENWKPPPKSEMTAQHSEQPPPNAMVDNVSHPAESKQPPSPGPGSEHAIETAKLETPPPQPGLGMLPPEPENRRPMQAPPEFMMVRPDGTTSEMPMEYQQRLQNREQLRSPFFEMSFETTPLGTLPKGIEFMLVLPGTGPGPGPGGGAGGAAATKPIRVGPAGYSNPAAHCQAKWSIEADDEDPGHNFLSLKHSTEQQRWIFMARFDLPSTIRNKAFMAAYTLRAGKVPPRIELHSNPGAGFLPQFEVSNQWKTYIIPMMQLSHSDVKSVMIAVRGTGDLDIREVRLESMPEMMRYQGREQRNPSDRNQGMGQNPNQGMDQNPDQGPMMPLTPNPFEKKRQ